MADDRQPRDSSRGLGADCHSGNRFNGFFRSFGEDRAKSAQGLARLKPCSERFLWPPNPALKRGVTAWPSKCSHRACAASEVRAVTPGFSPGYADGIKTSEPGFSPARSFPARFAHSVRTCATTILTILISLLATTAPAQPDSLLTVSQTEFLRIVLDGDGTLGFVVEGAEMETSPKSRLLNLLVDGMAEAGFSFRDDVEAGLGNDRFVATLETLGPRAIAVTWTPVDAQEHDFELNLRGTYSTAYYGTGERFHGTNITTS